VCRSHQTLAYL